MASFSASFNPPQNFQVPSGSPSAESQNPNHSTLSSGHSTRRDSKGTSPKAVNPLMILQFSSADFRHPNSRLTQTFADLSTPARLAPGVGKAAESDPSAGNQPTCPHLL